MEEEKVNIIRGAPLKGHISWETLRTVHVENYSFEKQTPRWWAIVSAYLYKKFRVVCSHNGVGAVLLEDDDENVINAFLDLIPQNAIILRHGDAVSRVTGMGRHWAIYDAEMDGGVFWEYQGPEADLKGKAKQVSGIFQHSVGDVVFGGTEGMIQKTSYQNFMGASGDLDLRVEDMDYTFSRHVVVERARAKEGLQQYHILYNNCESFIRWVITDKAVSQQSLEKMESYSSLAARSLLGAVVAVPTCLVIKYGGIGVMVRLALHSVGVPLFGPVYPMAIGTVSLAASILTPTAIAMRRIKGAVEAGPIHIYSAQP